jgi:hypothetical protein
VVNELDIIGGRDSLGLLGEPARREANSVAGAEVASGANQLHDRIAAGASLPPELALDNYPATTMLRDYIGAEVATRRRLYGLVAKCFDQSPDLTLKL